MRLDEWEAAVLYAAAREAYEDLASQEQTPARLYALAKLGRGLWLAESRMTDSEVSTADRLTVGKAWASVGRKAEASR